jgi:predicted DNA-binding transcriptional regulator AlpA
MEYAFNLKFKLAPGELDHDAIMMRLGEAGCDDALVGLGVAGHVGLEFIREAESADDAIVSAIDDVKKALPGAQLVEAGPDFVGLTDVADLVGVSRQNMRKLMLCNADAFPSPVHGGSSSVWHLAHVLRFMQQRHQFNLAKSILDVAHTAMQVNIVKEQAFMGLRVDEKLQNRLFMAILTPGQNTGTGGGIFQEQGPKGGKRYTTVSGHRPMPPTTKPGNVGAPVKAMSGSKR